MSEQWITVKAACAELLLGRSKVMELTEEIDPVTGKTFLVAWRPSECVIWIEAASVERHKRATLDANFWPLRRKLSEAPTQRDRERVLRAFGVGVAPSLQRV